MVFHAEQKTKCKEEDARCPNKWHASSAKAGKSNCVDQTSVEIIMKGARGEKKSVRGGSAEQRRSYVERAAGDYRLSTFAVKHADTRPIFFVSYP